MENFYELSNFSTFIQLLDALFISMCFDGIFYFWDPKFKESYNKIINKNKDPKGFPKQTVGKAFKELKTITDGVEWEFKHSIRKRAAFMIVFTTLLLLFCGFETYYHIQRNDPSYRSIAVTSIISLCYIAICLNKYLDIGKGKKDSNAYNSGFSMISLTYFIAIASFLAFYSFFDEISSFIIKFRYYISLIVLICYLIHMYAYRNKFSSVFINIWHYLGAIFFTIFPILISNYLFKFCDQYPIIIILAFCIYEIVWQLIVSGYYAKNYPSFLERKVKKAYSIIESYSTKNKHGKGSGKIVEEFKNTLYLRISNDVNRSKFYLFNLDIWETSKPIQFLIKLFGKKNNSDE